MQILKILFINIIGVVDAFACDAIVIVVASEIISVRVGVFVGGVGGNSPVPLKVEFGPHVHVVPVVGRKAYDMSGRDALVAQHGDIERGEKAPALSDLVELSKAYDSKRFGS